MPMHLNPRAYESLQERTLERLRARIPHDCPLRVERRAVDEARRTFVGFRVVGPGVEQVGRAQVVTAFIDGYVASWEHTQGLQRDYDEAVRLYRERDAQAARLHEELLKVTEKVEGYRNAAEDLAGRIQFLVDWADGRGLLGDHLFTFPDGDTWEAKR